MNLFLELGNTRIKVAIDSNQEYEFIGSFSFSEIEDTSFENLVDTQSSEIQQVFFSSVASQTIEDSIRLKIKEELKVYPTEFKTEAKCCGISFEYDDIVQLGIDRWLAIIGAACHSNQPFIIIDAGTATTIELVIDSVYKGGFIVPGLGLMRQSLAANTGLLTEAVPETVDFETKLMATNTEEAIHGGTLLMLASFINNTINHIEADTGRRCNIVGTGGEFQLVSRLLNKEAEFVEDLTIQGMIQVMDNL